ncbi:MAG: hypothetical protein IIW86_00490 [Clostridia bacterium]|nr:hypothetical protein [Clostridia bacterium]
MKIKSYIGGTLATLAFLWVLGTAGALEHDSITCLQAVIQSGLGILAAWAGLKMANVGD